MSAGFNPELGATRAATVPTTSSCRAPPPLLDLEPRDSPRVRATIEAVRPELSAGGPLLYRYPPGQDGLPGTEGAFLPCSYWLVQALASTGRVDEAAQLFADLLEFANPLGLLPEEINPRTTATSATTPRPSPTPPSSRPPWRSASLTPTNSTDWVATTTTVAADAAARRATSALGMDTVEVEQAGVQPIVGGQTARLSPGSGQQAPRPP